jgi:hypothetical protein
MCGNIVHGLSLLIVTTVTHGFLYDAVSFNFVTLTLCQSFPFSWSITDAEATLIVCLFPRLPPRIPITMCALAFHVRAGNGGASLASRLKSGTTMLTLISKLMIQCCVD